MGSNCCRRYCWWYCLVWKKKSGLKKRKIKVKPSPCEDMSPHLGTVLLHLSAFLLIECSWRGRNLTGESPDYLVFNDRMEFHKGKSPLLFQEGLFSVLTSVFCDYKILGGRDHSSKPLEIFISSQVSTGKDIYRIAAVGILTFNPPEDTRILVKCSNVGL